MISPASRNCRLTISMGIIAVVSLSTSLGSSTARADTTEDIKQAGDAIEVLLPLMALGSTFFVGDPEGSMWDREGTKQFTLSFGASWLTTRTMKIIAAKRRPNGDVRASYPSGHATAAFSAAAFIGTRYGGVWGWLAYGGAIFSGYSRVRADWHFADDVVAGTSIALLYNWAFVTSHHSRIQVLPTLDEYGAGVQVTVGQGAGGGGASTSETGFITPPRWCFKSAFGAVFLQKNQVTAPAGSGSTFDLNDFEKRDDPTATAGLGFEYLLNERHRLQISYIPFGVRDNGHFDEPVSFGGQIFPADTPIESDWRLRYARLSWRYALLQSSPWDGQVGLGLMLQETRISLQTEDESVRETVKDLTLVPYLHATLAIWLSKRWYLSADSEGTSLSEDWLLNVGLNLGYRLNRQWEFAAGYRYYSRRIDTDALVNESVYTAPHLAVNYAW